MISTYVLYSDSFERMYIGLSQDVEKRLIQHNKGQNKSTKAYKPWRLILEQRFDSRAEARKAERYLKSGIGREFIKSLLNSRRNH